MTKYNTDLGKCMLGDSLDVLSTLPDDSIDLIITSPPFSLQRHKRYGEPEQNEYVDWLLQFGKAALPKLKETGSFVIDLGGAYQKGRPVKALYPFKFMIRMVEDIGYKKSPAGEQSKPARHEGVCLCFFTFQSYKPVFRFVFIYRFHQF